MSFLTGDIKRIKAFLFDVDGVLSPVISPLDETGEPVRTANVRDGYAIRIALSQGFEIGIITGGWQKRVELRYRKIGVRYYYDKASDKVSRFNDFVLSTGISPGEILYMGDDLPDYGIMKIAGFSACPADAVDEIKSLAGFVSVVKGGYGCVREVIEMVLKAQDKWLNI